MLWLFYWPQFKFTPHLREGDKAVGNIPLWQFCWLETLTKAIFIIGRRDNCRQNYSSIFQFVVLIYASSEGGRQRNRQYTTLVILLAVELIYVSSKRRQICKYHTPLSILLDVQLIYASSEVKRQSWRKNYFSNFVGFSFKLWPI